MNKKILTVAIASSLGAVAYSNTASAAMASDAALNFDAGITTCVANAGTPPDNCTYGSRVKNDSGSYFGMDTNGNGTIAATERTAIAPGSQGGVNVNSTQTTEGQLDATWLFFGNAGNHTTVNTTTILSDNGAGAVTLDFSGWNVSWNNIPLINMGGGSQDCGTASDGICSGTDGDGNPFDIPGIQNNGNSIAAVTCGVDCAFGDTFTLNYAARVPFDDVSGFGGVSYDLFLSGTVGTAVPVPAAVWLFGSGLLGLVGVARRRKA